MKEFDAFISYETSSGQAIATKLCEYLENGGLKCWIAPRNIQYGQVYAGVISGAIKSSEFIVCVYTDNFNKSHNVKREIELANANKISILPLIISDVPFDADLEYYFAAHQQIRVPKNNLEKGFDDVLKTIKHVAKRDAVRHEVTEPKAAEPKAVVPQVETRVEPRVETSHGVTEKKENKTPAKKRVILYSAIAAVAAVAVITLIFFLTKPEEEIAVEEVIEEVMEQRKTFDVNGTEFAMVLINDTMYAGETEVTQGLWKAVMGSTIEEQRDKVDVTWATRGTGDECPMYYVNLSECLDFAAKLSMITGKRFELPTDKEWEMCISNESESSVEEIAWYAQNSGDSVHPVATKKANSLGIYDIVGNVSEWCNTRCEGNAYVCRGSDWCMAGGESKATARDKCEASMRRSSLGFRIVMKTKK